MVFKEYEDPSELKRLQELSETVLAEFDRVCRELDIPYFAYAGTALGAVRHGGFIPWDDDIDVAMPRDAYERFLANAPALLDERFEVANTRTEPDFTSPYSYLTLKGTCCIPDFYRACPYKKPISIDVFPFDKVSNDPAVRKHQMRGTWLWGRLMFLRATPEPYLAFDGVKRTLVLAICRCAHGLLKLLGQTPRKLQRRWDAAARLAEHEDSDILADFSDRFPLAWSAREDELFPTVDMTFDSTIVKMPRAWDALLTRSYGDYRELPPIEQRKNHHPHRLDFGPYGKEA